jgi:hypothetical protein
MQVSDEDVILTETTRRLEEFRAYLNAHAEEFMDKEGFSNYFNIPFILSIEGDRQEEFREFFEQSWTEGITNDLAATLEEMVQETEGLDEAEGKTGTQLEQILQFYIRHNARGNATEANTRWEEIEMMAEEAAAGIEKQKTANKRKMVELSTLSHKYEGLKVEYESYLGQLEDKMKTEITYQPGTLLVENKSRQKAIDEREKHEAEALKNVQKDLGKKFNVQELRLFRNQYKEKFANYKFLTYNASKSNEQLKDLERVWRRILFDYSYSSFSYAKAAAGGDEAMKTQPPEEKTDTENKKDGVKDPPKKPAVKPTPVKTIPKEEVEKKQKKVISLDKEFAQYRPYFNNDHDSLKKLMKEISVEDAPTYDKKYKLDEAYIESCIQVTKDDLLKVKASLDPPKEVKPAPGKDDAKAPKEDEKPKEDPKKEPATDPKQPIGEGTTSSEYAEDIRERTSISLSVLNQKLLISKDFVVPKEELFFEQICQNLSYMIKKLAKGSKKITEMLERELELSMTFILRMIQHKNPYRERLRRQNFIFGLFLEIYTYVETNAKPLAEANRLVYFTQQVMKLSRLILESYREYPQNVPKSFENFAQLYSSKGNFNVPPKSVNEVDFLLISCVALVSKQAGDQYEMEREVLAKFIVEDCSKQYPEKVPKLVELSTESSLVVLAAIGRHQRLGQVKGLRELLGYLETHPVFSKFKVLQ